jgi:hypothetical protein
VSKCGVSGVKSVCERERERGRPSLYRGLGQAVEGNIPRIHPALLASS